MINRKHLKAMLFAGFLGVMTLASTVPSMAATGWNKVDNQWVYYDSSGNLRKAGFSQHHSDLSPPLAHLLASVQIEGERLLQNAAKTVAPEHRRLSVVSQSVERIVPAAADAHILHGVHSAACSRPLH